LGDALAEKFKPASRTAAVEKRTKIGSMLAPLRFGAA
jgi:hypothetical protein